MNKEAQIWEKINTPKIEGLITAFDKNRKPRYTIRIIDPKNIPPTQHKRGDKK